MRSRAFVKSALLCLPLLAAACGPMDGGGGGNPTNITYSEDASEHRGKNGQRFRYVCPPNGTTSSVWGTDVYTDDSSICTAAVHAGKFSLAAGGTVTIEIRPGQAAYVGTTRNSVTSSDYGSWSGSFVFP
ncbi:MAG TPA: LCCL domain-containing protein [Myxococcaceae bacterium]|nr:LCCL domain-containing protein [Myxococcaceae bacterium]